MPFNHIRTHVESHVFVLELARPEKRNALGLGTGSNRTEITDALREADKNSDVRAILICAEGDAFSAGGDLGGLELEGPEDDISLITQVDEFHRAIDLTSKPVVSAVNGFCLGAGLSMVAHTDLVIAGSDAKFGVPEARFGHPAGSELVSLVGASWSKYLAFTGELIDAQTAVRIGLAITVIPAERLRSDALRLAARIAEHSSLALANNKRAIDAAADAHGRVAGRVAGRLGDTRTLLASHAVRGENGIPFDQIREQEGVRGLLRAVPRHSGPWLSTSDGGEV